MTTNRRAFLGLLVAGPVVAKQAIAEAPADVWNFRYYPDAPWTAVPGEVVSTVDWTTARRGVRSVDALFYGADPALTPIFRPEVPNRLFGVEINENGEAV